MIYVILAYLTYPFVFFLSRLAARHEPNSVIVFQTAKIGDMVCSTPVFRGIKKAFPHSKLGVVIDPVTFGVLKHNPYIDEIMEMDRKTQRGLIRKLLFAYRLYKKGYSAALILMPNVTNLVVPFWAMIPRRVAISPDFKGKTLKEALNLATRLEYHINPRMAMQTYLNSLKHLGITGCEPVKEVYASPEAQKKVFDLLRGEGPFAGIVLGTGNSLKDWGRDKFVSLGKMILKETGCRLALFGPESEKEAAQELAAAYGKDRVLDFCGVFSLAELPAALKRLSVVAGVDTGLIYMADALNVPAVVIAGPCDMQDQRPTGQRCVVIQDRGLECVPCSHTFSAPYECRYKHRRCVLDISAETVFRAVARALPSAAADTESQGRF